MPAPRPSEPAVVLRGALFGIAALCLSHAASADDLPLAELGRRIYVDGILPDGKPLVAIRPAGATATAVEAACASCHRRSGYGSSEGRILVPPIAGAVLFAPGVFAPQGAHAIVSAVERFRERPAYDERKLQRTLRSGIDPGGTPLRAPMPRYRLDALSTRALAAYLNRLSAAAVPGMDGNTLHLATVISPDVPPAQRDALVEVLRAYAATRRGWGMDWQLHVWQLQGEQQEWAAQLDTFQRQQPVYALLSGMGRAEWQEVHRFCERQALPCVLPSLELPPHEAHDHYSLYFSAGLALEARLLARELTAQADAPQQLVQVAADDAGRQAAAALRQALAEAGSTIDAPVLSPQDYVAGPAVWWLRPTQIAELSARLHEPPATLYLSAQLAPPEQQPLPEAWQPVVRYVSLFDPLAARRTQTTLLPWLQRQGLATNELRVRGDAYAACNFFANALTMLQQQAARGMRGPLTQERLLETLESNMTVYRDDAAPYYWQMSLGPAQRLLVKGGMLLRYAGANEWTQATARVAP